MDFYDLKTVILNVLIPDDELWDVFEKDMASIGVTVRRDSDCKRCRFRNNYFCEDGICEGCSRRYTDSFAAKDVKR